MGSQNCRFLRIREKLHVVILLAFKISDMVYSDIELMESTKRCLFPPDGASNPQSEERRNPGYDSKIKKYEDESVTSPTSVSAYPLQTSKQETITMSDDGAEALLRERLGRGERVVQLFAWHEPAHGDAGRLPIAELPFEPLAA